MREIRFRAWSKVEKIMYKNCVYNCKDAFEMQLSHPQIYEVMEYTGMTDIHGVKICEGDILRYEFEEECSVTGIVTYTSGCFCIDNDILAPLHSLSQKEVLGNVYENPELIEEG